MFCHDFIAINALAFGLIVYDIDAGIFGYLLALT